MQRRRRYDEVGLRIGVARLAPGLTRRSSPKILVSSSQSFTIRRRARASARRGSARCRFRDRARPASPRSAPPVRSPARRRNSSAATTTTSSRPCTVTCCGPSLRARRTSSLKRALAQFARPYPFGSAPPICLATPHPLPSGAQALDRHDRRRPRKNPRHRAHRLSRRRQDDAAQPHPERAARRANTPSSSTNSARSASTTNSSSAPTRKCSR